MDWTNDKILLLLSAFDKPDCSFFNCYFRGDISTWQPGTEPEKKAFAELTAPENRSLLKHWYAKEKAINPMAEAMRRILERETKEQLPVGGR